MNRHKFKVLSLFSGAMGLDIGLEQSDKFETLGAVDIDPVFCETIKKNRDNGRTALSNLKIFNRDIRNLDPQRLMDDLGISCGEIDLLVGGPPCQTFSTTGRRQTVQDYRGTLIWEFLRFVEALKPRFFLMENVRGLVSAALRHRPINQRPQNGGPPLATDEIPGSVLRKFAEDLGKIPGDRYRLDAFEVNAVNYGAPQLRERLLCIGNRVDQIVEFPEPTHNPPTTPSRGKISRKHKEFRTLGDVIKNLSEVSPVLMDFSPRKKKYLSLVPPGGNWRSLPIGIQKESMGKAWHAKGGRSGWWRRLSYDLPCPTIVTMPNHASTALCHPEEVRVLSVRECALVQEFPTDWEFVGGAQEQYAQIGNAVPVRLGKIAGNVIASYLEDLTREVKRREPEVSHCNDKICTKNFRLVYLRSHVRTRQWFKGGKTFVWKDGNENQRLRYRPSVTLRKERAI